MTILIRMYKENKITKLTKTKTILQAAWLKEHVIKYNKTYKSLEKITSFHNPQFDFFFFFASQHYVALL